MFVFVMQNVMQNTLWIISTLAILFAVLYIYYPLYTLVGLFKSRHFPETKKLHHYAILIAARNEETVLPQLLQSILKQDYPSEYLTIFVVADNCTDQTARLARENGANCYERFDPDHKTKGFALEFLMDHIQKDYGIESFDAYLILDADNLLKRDYMTQMNRAFADGNMVVTSYRNTKNIGDNWISASYAIHWLRTVLTELRGKSVLRMPSRVQGTGYLFHSSLVKNGWHYTGLTEDRAFCADVVVQGHSISYCHDAEFYDEQPTSMKIAFRQRIRWSKGHLQVFMETGPKLLKSIFKNRSLHSYDMLLTVIPNNLIVFVLRFLKLFVEMYLAYTLVEVHPSSHILAPLSKILLAYGFTTLKKALFSILVAIIVFITERKRIVKMSLFKKLIAVLMFPLFDIIGVITIVIALFIKVEWKPIPHTSEVDIHDIEEGLDR